MLFKIDENLPVEMAVRLRASGHDAVTVLDERLGGSPDAEVLSRCTREHRALITLDLGFSDIRSYPPAGSPGIVVLRLGRQDRESVLEACARLTRLLQVESLERSLWIVEDERVRIRR